MLRPTFVARILHIEDDPRNRLLVKKLLSAAGHEVVDAVDGLEGVRLALTTHPALVLVDLRLPGLDGFEVALRLRSEPALKSVPIVAITAEGDRDTSFAVGCDGYVAKPIDARRFAADISAYLTRDRGGVPSDDLQAVRARLMEQSGKIVARLEHTVLELQLANKRLVEAEAHRTAFYRNLSHELATPLTPIVGYVRMLLNDELGSLTESQKKALSAVESSVFRLRGTLDNLVDVTSLELENVNFARISYDVVSLVRELLEERRVMHPAVEIVCELPKEALWLQGDRERTRRAIGHLVDNALKFGRGSFGVRVCALARECELMVADQGPGIASEHKGRIFEAFFQADASPTREHGGVGVGLAIVRRIARGQGGDVTLVADPATIGGTHFRGAAFRLTLALGN